MPQGARNVVKGPFTRHPGLVPLTALQASGPSGQSWPSDPSAQQTLVEQRKWVAAC